MSDSTQEYRRIVSALGGCTDGNCRIRKPTGMHTNGGCQCVKRGSKVTVNHWGLIALQAQKMADEIERLAARVADLEADKRRLDWLADRDNHIGNVQLPAECVERNVHSLRSAIDDAMGIDEDSFETKQEGQ